MGHAMKTIALIIGTFLVYLTANIMAGLMLGVYYAGRYGEGGSPEGLDRYIAGNTNLLLIAASLIALAVFWAAYRLRGKRITKSLRISRIGGKNSLYSLLVGSLFSLLLFAFMSLTNIYRLFPSHGEVIESIIPAEANFLLIFLSVAIVVPLFEEIMHRGIIYQQFKKGLSVPAAIFFQGVVFGLFHFNWLQGMYAFAGGIVLALTFEYTKTLWAPILMHMGWNATSLFVPGVSSNAVLLGILVLSLAGLTGLLQQMKNHQRRAYNGKSETADNPADGTG